MELIPSQQEVLDILRRTGAMRKGHFELTSGRHTDHYLQMPLAMRYYQEAKTLSVAISRLLRGDSEIARHLPRVSIVSPATGGIPVAYGLGEALRARPDLLGGKGRGPDGVPPVHGDTQERAVHHGGRRPAFGQDARQVA